MEKQDLDGQNISDDERSLRDLRERDTAERQLEDLSKDYEFELKLSLQKYHRHMDRHILDDYHLRLLKPIFDTVFLKHGRLPQVLPVSRVH